MTDLSLGPSSSAAWADIVGRLGGVEALDASARCYGAFQRARNIKSAVDLLQLVLAYGPGGRSLRMTAAEALLHGIADVSDVALLERFRRCPAWLTALCERVLAPLGDLPSGDGSPIHLIDGSRLEGPGRSCWRLHLCYAAGRQRIVDFAVTGLDQAEKLDRVAIRPGEIRIGDRAYPNPKALRAVRDAGADLLVRLTWKSLNLRDAAGQPLDWLALFTERAAAGRLDMPVTVHKARGAFEALPLRLVILPKPPEMAERARETSRRTAQKNQHKIDPRTIEAAGYLILLTSLDASAYPTDQLGTLYRVRWQIELAIKRLKSILRIDRLPAKDPELAKAWILAHLLFALLIDDAAAEMAAFFP
ncbi:MAG: IS4 family transposase [Aliidongia sp.]